MPFESIAKRHLDLRHAARRRRDAHQLEPAQRLVLGGDLALALEDVDLHDVLVVDHGGEDLRVLGRDRRVALDQPGEQAALGLDAERERRDVEQHQVLDVAAQDAALDGGAHGHHLVGVDLPVRLAAEDPLHRPHDHRRAGLAADQQHLVDLVGAQAGLLAGRPGRAPRCARPARATSASKWSRVSVRARWRGPVRSAEMNGRLIAASSARGELALGALGGLLEALQRHAVAAQVDAGLLLEVLDQPVHDALVEVLAAQEGVAGGGAHLEDALGELEDRDVEGAAAEVVDRDGVARPRCGRGRRRARRRWAR